MNADDSSARNREICRRINRSAAEQFHARGVLPADIATAAVLSAHDCMTAALDGDRAGAIEAIRTIVDHLERALLDQEG